MKKSSFVEIRMKHYGEKFPMSIGHEEIFEHCIGTNIGKGWTPLVNALIGILIELDPDIKILQIKEKFGGLRFYYRSQKEFTKKRMDLLVEATEKKAITICERCGTTDNVETKAINHWFKTFCPECRAKKEEDVYVKGKRLYEED